MGPASSLFFVQIKVLYARNVVDLCAVKIAVGQKSLVELNELAALNGLFFQLGNLRLAAVYPDNFVGLGKLCALFHKIENFLVFGRCHNKSLLKNQNLYQISLY